MSIASIIKGDEFDEFKWYLRSNAPAKKHFISSTGYSSFSKTIPVIVPAEKITSHESTQIGELSDFLFCLEIAKYVDTNKELVIDSLLWRTRELFDGCVRTNRQNENNKDHCDLFDEAIENCCAYALGSNVDLRKLVQYASTLNKAEHYLHYTRFKSRAEFLDNFLIPCSSYIENEVVKLLEVFKEKFISSGIVKKDSAVVCHPWFEPWSSEVGGGVADLYLDGVLYDFKSTKKTGYSWEDVAQVYGYYVLNRLCLKYSLESVSASPIPITNIHAIALYYSRLGDIELCNLADSNAVLADSEIEYVSNLIHNHNEKLHQAFLEKQLESVAKRIILKKISQEKNNPTTILHTPETIGYNVGDVVYSYVRGKGKVLQFKLIDHVWNVVIEFESGQTLGGNINSNYLLNWNSQEMIEWRKIFEDYYRADCVDKDAVSALLKKYSEL